MSERPLAVVIGGVNGAGKSTAGHAILGDVLDRIPFVNADAIAKGLNAFDPESVALSAGRIMLQRMHELKDAKESFAFETTLAGKTYRAFLDNAKSDGYQIQIHYFWLPSAELAIERVRLRVALGGHNIPEATIRLRYRRSALNFWNLYRPIADRWYVYDNSGSFPIPIADGIECTSAEIWGHDEWLVLQEVIAHEK